MTRSSRTATTRSASWRSRTPTAPASRRRAEKTFTDVGGEVVVKIIYDPKAATLLGRGRPDQGGRPRRHRAHRLRRDHEDHPRDGQAGHRPGTTRTSTSWTATSPTTPRTSPRASQGVKGTIPGVDAGDDFKARLTERRARPDRVHLLAGVLRRHHPRRAGRPGRDSDAGGESIAHQDARRLVGRREVRRPSPTASSCSRTARTSTTRARAARSSSTRRVTPPSPPSASTSTATTTCTPSSRARTARSDLASAHRSRPLTEQHDRRGPATAGPLCCRRPVRRSFAT